MAIVIFSLLLITTVQCSINQRQFGRSDQTALIIHQEARYFGSLVGILLGQIDWLPIEINVIDVMAEVVQLLSGWLLSSTAASSTAAVTSMTVVAP